MLLSHRSPRSSLFHSLQSLVSAWFLHSSLFHSRYLSPLERKRGLCRGEGRLYSLKLASAESNRQPVAHKSTRASEHAIQAVNKQLQLATEQISNSQWNSVNLYNPWAYIQEGIVGRVFCTKRLRLRIGVGLLLGGEGVGEKAFFRRDLQSEF